MPKSRPEPESEEEESEFSSKEPYTVVSSYVRRTKPKGVMKDWWDNEFYENESPSPKSNKDTERRYLGHRILPPDLGGTL